MSESFGGKFLRLQKLRGKNFFPPPPPPPHILNSVKRIIKYLLIYIYFFVFIFIYKFMLFKYISRNFNKDISVQFQLLLLLLLLLVLVLLLVLLLLLVLVHVLEFYVIFFGNNLNFISFTKQYLKNTFFRVFLYLYQMSFKCISSRNNRQ